MAQIDTHTLIVGAGPSGLAMAACLTRQKVPYVLLERAEQVGSAWRSHYERLHLHTVRKHSNLPYFPFPESAGKYPSRQSVVDYLDAYAKYFGMQPRFGENVTSIRRENGRWFTGTSKGAYASDCVVIAAGYNRRPVIPKWPGQETYSGTIVHSASYRNGEMYRDKRVLIVGIGNTGGEIAIDLCEHGAAAVHVCVRSPINVIRREYLGTPAQVSGIWMSKLPRGIAYPLSKWLAHFSVGDLSQYGIAWPGIGPMESVERFGRVALIDIGTIDLIKRGAIKVVPGVQRLHADGVEFVDGEKHIYDAVILATGYKPRIDEFLENAGETMDESGYPIPPAGESKWSGLYFLGYVNPATGLLRQSGIDAKRVAVDIARKYSEQGKQVGAAH
ncbi:MAG: NAD(P)-binding domain-containing protein [Candidatus Hydrogenedentes bacterium]|nr:NAD(P)-binding domain-containing protein [Candidatus Hydrogenedentota bacterium]